MSAKAGSVRVAAARGQHHLDLVGLGQDPGHAGDDLRGHRLSPARAASARAGRNQSSSQAGPPARA